MTLPKNPVEPVIKMFLPLKNYNIDIRNFLIKKKINLYHILKKIINKNLLLLILFYKYFIFHNWMFLILF